MADEYSQSIAFTVVGHPDDFFSVFRVRGEEEVSALFHFDVQMVADSPDLSLPDMVGSQATLTFQRHNETRSVHGIVDFLQQLGMTTQGQYIYRATLVPRLSKLAMSRQNQVYGTNGEASVVDVISAELTAASKAGPGQNVAGRLGQQDSELRLSGAYPKRDYIVQYDESDLDFVSRLAEQAGIFYFFEHDGQRDIVVFGDAAIAFKQIAGQSPLVYRPDGGLINVARAAVRGFSCSARPLPRKIYLRDYNYRLPQLSLLAETEVDTNGHGVIVEYGAHFKTPEEGSQIASVRARELACRQLIFEGESNCIYLSAGHLFDFDEHFRADFNQNYIITAVEHEATVALPGIPEVSGGGGETGYLNRFTCIPRSADFKPERKTAKPVMAGLANAHVDASGGGARAEIDSEGRYKVRQTFDLRGESDGKSSRYVRKAEPYGGANNGMHFPLLKGTEVVIGCVNGDPDRPIILGAVPNPRNQSVVGSANSTVNKVRTPSGISLEMGDGPGSSGGGGGGGSGSAALAPQRALERGNGNLKAAKLDPQRQLAEVSESGDNYARLSVPNSSYTSYLRLGQSDTDSTESAYKPGIGSVNGGLMFYTALDSNSWVKGSSYNEVDGTLRFASTNTYDASSTETGLFSKKISLTATTASPADSATITPESTFADGGIQLVADTNLVETVGADIVRNVTGNVTETIGEDLTQNITGSFSQTVTSNATWTTLGSDWSHTTGNTRSIFAGSKFTLNLAALATITIGLKLTVNVGLQSTVNVGAQFNISVGPTFDIKMLSSQSNTLTLKFDGLKVSASTTKADAALADAKSKLADAEASSMKGGLLGLQGKVGNLSADVENLIFKP
jgi:type VI secretion system VgrG family protein